MKSKEWIEAGAKQSIEQAKTIIIYLRCAFYNITEEYVGATYEINNDIIDEIDEEFRKWLHNNNDGSKKFDTVYQMWQAFNNARCIIFDNEYTLEHLMD